MKLNTNRAKSAGIQTGAAVLGAVVAHAGTKAITDMVVQQSADSKIIPHIPALVLGAILAAQAFDVLPKGNDYVASAVLGASVTTGMSAVREYTGANDDTKNTAGIAAMVNKYVPGLNGVGMGYLDYTESAPLALLQAGSQQYQLQEFNAPQTGADIRRAFAE